QVTYSNLLKTMQEIELAEARAAEQLRPIEPAAEPPHPAKPNVLLNTLAGLLVGLVGSIGLALLLQYADDTLKTREDATRALGQPGRHDGPGGEAHPAGRRRPAAPVAAPGVRRLQPPRPDRSAAGREPRDRGGRARHAGARPADRAVGPAAPQPVGGGRLAAHA